MARKRWIGAVAAVGATVLLILCGCPKSQPSDALAVAAQELFAKDVDANTATSDLVSAYAARIATVGFGAATAELDRAIAGRIRCASDAALLIRRNSEVAASSFPKLARKDGTADGKVTVLFINGVWNLDFQAFASAQELRQRLADVDGVSVDYFYNPTVSMEQEADFLGGPILGPSSYLSQRLFPRIVEALRTHASMTGGLIDLAQAFQQNDDYRALFGAFGAWINRPVLDALTTRLRSEFAAGCKVILLPHSQGNYYARDAIMALTPDERQKVALLEVATPVAEPPDVGERHAYVNNAEDPTVLLSCRAPNAVYGHCEFTFPVVTCGPPIAWCCAEAHDFHTGYMDDTLTTNAVTIRAHVVALRDLLTKGS